MTPDRSDVGQDLGLPMADILRLLQHLVLAPREVNPGLSTRARILTELAEDMTAFCRALELSRAAVFEAQYDDYFDGLRLYQLAVSASAEGSKAAGQGQARSKTSLPIASKSEVFSLLNEGHCIPLGQVNTGSGASASSPQALIELAEFLGLRGNAGAVLFPLASSTAGKLRGLVLMEREGKAGGFSENLLDLGTVVCQLLEPKLIRLSEQSSHDESAAAGDQDFERRVLPVVVINRRMLMIEKLNDAARRFLTRPQGDLEEGTQIVGRKLSMVFPGASQFIEVLEKACAKNAGPSCFSLAAKDLSHTGCAFALISLVGDGGSQVWVQLIPENFLPENLSSSEGGQTSSPIGGSFASSVLKSSMTGSAGRNISGGTSGGAGTASRAAAPSGDEAVADLSRRLNFERWLRLTVCKLHASLDRDHVLQTLADSLGRAFHTTRCLVIRTDGPSHPMVTHEYVEPDLSPLGLGRTGQFPAFALSLFTQKCVSFGDISQMKTSGPLTADEVDQLIEHGIVSIAGAPLSFQGQPYGVLILVDGSRVRKWTEEEMETIELTTSQASVSLSHSQTYHQTKDQLFHMNLLGNLTQQLTNALEVATKAPSMSSSAAPDKSQADGPLTPLSSRELEVLRLIASGYTNREIAQRLFLTESTVELHASRIRKKLHLKSRTALVKYACDYGLV